jgi:hypothetical protein
MGVHCVHCLHKVAGRSVEQVLSCSLAPEGVAVEAMVRLRTQSNISIVAVFLNQASLHKESSLLAHHRSMTSSCNPPNGVLSELSRFCLRMPRSQARQKEVQRRWKPALGQASTALHQVLRERGLGGGCRPANKMEQAQTTNPAATEIPLHRGLTNPCVARIDL